MKARNFLTKEEISKVEDAIRRAETETSGEIRIHIENKCSVDPKERALRTFNILHMRRTEQRNGVLIYVASESRKFAVIGDSGINGKVPHGFWKDVCDVLGEAFKAGRNADGLIKAVEMTGEKLKSYFPYRSGDKDELPDEISFHDEDGEEDGED